MLVRKGLTAIFQPFGVKDRPPQRKQICSSQPLLKHREAYQASLSYARKLPKLWLRFCVFFGTFLLESRPLEQTDGGGLAQSGGLRLRLGSLERIIGASRVSWIVKRRSLEPQDSWNNTTGCWRKRKELYGFLQMMLWIWLLWADPDGKETCFIAFPGSSGTPFSSFRCGEPAASTGECEAWSRVWRPRGAAKSAWWWRRRWQAEGESSLVQDHRSPLTWSWSTSKSSLWWCAGTTSLHLWSHVVSRQNTTWRISKDWQETCSVSTGVLRRYEDEIGGTGA